MEGFFNMATQIALKPSIALNNNNPTSTYWAKNHAISINGPIEVKSSVVVVPIKIFNIITWKETSKRILLDRHTLAYKATLYNK